MEDAIYFVMAKQRGMIWNIITVPFNTFEEAKSEYDRITKSDHRIYDEFKIGKTVYG